MIAMEACATAHGWGRKFEGLGHDVRLIPPVYVKTFVKRQKNYVADAEAIVEAALLPTMRFVAVMTEDQQARAMLFRTRQMFVGQRTQMINALRGHLAEHGLVAARGPAHLKNLTDAIALDHTLAPFKNHLHQWGHPYMHKLAVGQESPFPRRIYPTAFVTGMPRAV
jgi:transposase